MPSSLLYEAGTEPIIVQTPVPNTINFSVNITVTPVLAGSTGFNLTTVSVQANDMVWDPVSQKLYLSVAGTDPTYPNAIVALDPVTGQFGASVGAPGADRLAVSSDGSWLYAGLDKSATVQRYALPSLTVDISIPLGTDPTNSMPYSALSLATEPGSPDTVAISKASFSLGIGVTTIYDGSTARPATFISFISGASSNLPAPISCLEWNLNGANLYGVSDPLYGGPVVTLSVNASGVQLAQNSSQGQQYLGCVHFSSSTGHLFSDSGSVIDPSTDEAVNQLLMSTAANVQSFGPYTPLALDDNLSLAWDVAEYQQTQAISAFDINNYTYLGAIEIPNVVDSPVKLVRWGTNGLAFFTQAFSDPQQGDGVYIVSGAFVTTPSVQIVRVTRARF